MAPPVLAFLNLGPTELVLIVLLLVVLFGADKAPELARSLGRARSEIARAEGQLKEAIVSEEERLLAEQLKFEAAREHAIKQTADADGELLALRRAAEELGVVVEGLSKEQLKAEIAARVGGGSARGEGS